MPPLLSIGGPASAVIRRSLPRPSTEWGKTLSDSPISPQPNYPAPPFDRLPAVTLNWRNKPWRLGVLIAHILRRPQDRIFSDVTVFHGTDHLLPYLSGIKGVLTLHDFTYRLCPKTHTVPNRLFLTLAMRCFLRAANALIAVSECTKRDATRLYGVEPSKVTVIHLGVDPRFRPVSRNEKTDLREKYGLPDHFLLVLGTLEPRKNLAAVLDAYCLLKRRGLRHKLVVAGKRGWLFQKVLDKIEKLGLGDDLIMTGHIPDADLPTLYGSADLFVFPSLYEGFGLPVLEAMACGTPVACSNASSLPEVVGPAALLFDPRDPGQIAEGITHVLENSSLIEQLREKGRIRAKELTWDKTAQETARVYRRVIG